MNRILTFFFLIVISIVVYGQSATVTVVLQDETAAVEDFKVKEESQIFLENQLTVTVASTTEFFVVINAQYEAQFELYDSSNSLVYTHHGTNPTLGFDGEASDYIINDGESYTFNCIVKAKSATHEYFDVVVNDKGKYVLDKYTGEDISFLTIPTTVTDEFGYNSCVSLSSAVTGDHSDQVTVAKLGDDYCLLDYSSIFSSFENLLVIDFSNHTLDHIFDDDGYLLFAIPDKVKYIILSPDCKEDERVAAFTDNDYTVYYDKLAVYERVGNLVYAIVENEGTKEAHIIDFINKDGVQTVTIPASVEIDGASYPVNYIDNFGSGEGVTSISFDASDHQINIYYSVFNDDSFSGLERIDLSKRSLFSYYDNSGEEEIFNVNSNETRLLVSWDEFGAYIDGSKVTCAIESVDSATGFRVEYDRVYSFYVITGYEGKSEEIVIPLKIEDHEVKVTSLGKSAEVRKISYEHSIVSGGQELRTISVDVNAYVYLENLEEVDEYYVLYTNGVTQLNYNENAPISKRKIENTSYLNQISFMDATGKVASAFAPGSVVYVESLLGNKYYPILKTGTGDSEKTVELKWADGKFVFTMPSENVRVEKCTELYTIFANVANLEVKSPEVAFIGGESGKYQIYVESDATSLSLKSDGTSTDGSTTLLEVVTNNISYYYNANAEGIYVVSNVSSGTTIKSQPGWYLIDIDESVGVSSFEEYGTSMVNAPSDRYGKAGNLLTINIENNDGILRKINVKDENEKDIAIDEKETGKSYSFTMPAGGITISADKYYKISLPSDNMFVQYEITDAEYMTEYGEDLYYQAGKKLSLTWDVSTDFKSEKIVKYVSGDKEIVPNKVEQETEWGETQSIDELTFPDGELVAYVDAKLELIDYEYYLDWIKSDYYEPIANITYSLKGKNDYVEEENTLQVVIDESTDISEVANVVNNGSSLAENIIITLDKDITLVSTDEEYNVWNEIGTEDNPFKGTFDGNGHTIVALGETADNTVATLFGAIAEEATVSNLNIGQASVDDEGKVTSDVHIEATTASDVTATVKDKDGKDVTKQYYGVLAQKNEGTSRTWSSWATSASVTTWKPTTSK